MGSNLSVNPKTLPSLATRVVQKLRRSDQPESSKVRYRTREEVEVEFDLNLHHQFEIGFNPAYDQHVEREINAEASPELRELIANFAAIPKPEECLILDERTGEVIGENDAMKQYKRLITLIKKEGIITALLSGGFLTWCKLFNGNPPDTNIRVLVRVLMQCDYVYTNLTSFRSIQGELQMIIKTCWYYLLDKEDDLRNLMDPLILETNRSNEQTAFLMRWGLGEIVFPIVVNEPRDSFKSVSFQDDAHPPWWIAFDIVTNLAKWPCCKKDMLEYPGLVERLYDLTAEDNYFGFEASEGLAYLVGRCGKQLDKKYADFTAPNVSRILKYYGDILRGHSILNGLGFGVFGRCLAVRRLAENPNNLKHLKPAIGLLLESITKEQRSVPVSIRGIRDLIRDKEILREFYVLSKKKPLGFFNRFSYVEDEMGNPSGSEVCLFHCPNPNLRDEYGRTALSYAVSESLKGTQLLIRYGGDLDALGHDNLSCRDYAVKGRNREVVELVLRDVIGEEANLSLLTLKTLLIKYLSIAEDEEIIRYLVKLGAEANEAWLSDEDNPQRSFGYRLGLRDRFVNFLFSQHQRLGQACVKPLKLLDENVLLRIRDFYVAPITREEVANFFRMKALDDGYRHHMQQHIPQDNEEEDEQDFVED